VPSKNKTATVQICVIRSHFAVHRRDDRTNPIGLGALAARHSTHRLGHWQIQRTLILEEMDGVAVVFLRHGDPDVAPEGEMPSAAGRVDTSVIGPFAGRANEKSRLCFP
jgi:hypothetical protein